MTQATILDPLVLDFVEWIAKEPRAYADVLDAWRTSCPRLTVWEDAIDRGLVDAQADARTAAHAGGGDRGGQAIFARASPHAGFSLASATASHCPT